VRWRFYGYIWTCLSCLATMGDGQTRMALSEIDRSGGDRHVGRVCESIQAESLDLGSPFRPRFGLSKSHYSAFYLTNRQGLHCR
jgi:hypothetical protein